jgi:hypothetical protein
MSANEVKIQKLTSEVKQGISELGDRLEKELSRDPGFFGGGSFEVWVKDGAIVSTKVSVDITKKP